MTPEERKAIVMRPGKKWSIADPACERLYPKCCTYHEGFDDGLLISDAKRKAIEELRDYTLNVILRIHDFTEDGQRDILWTALGRVVTDLSNLTIKDTP